MFNEKQIYFTFYCTLFLLIFCLINTISGQYAGSKRYGISSRCTGADREEVNRCEDEARRDWDVRDFDYNTQTRKFCCFVWDTLSCELGILQRCDPNYAAELSTQTEQRFSSYCDYHTRRSASCALRWWSLSLIILALIVIIGIIVFIVYRKRQSKLTYDYETVTKMGSGQR